MGRKSWVVLALGLLLSACYQVTPAVVEAGVAVPGWKDGVYGRDDGTQVDVHWDGDQGAYVVGAGGMVRLAALADGLYLADYQAERRIVMLARLDSGGDVVFLIPPAVVETRLAKAQGLGLRPGPIPRLEGSASAIRAYFNALVADKAALVEAGRLRWLHS